jgi:hypothetical protein
MKDTSVMKMKEKLDAFFANASKEDISALLQRTNYDFYKNIDEPCENWIECVFDAKEQWVFDVTVRAGSYDVVPNGPIVYIGRDFPVVDHPDLALAA